MGSPLDSYDLEKVNLTLGERKLSERPGVEGEIMAFIGLSSVAKMGMRTKIVKIGDTEPLPLSSKGKTRVRFVGEAPKVSTAPGRYGNLLMQFTGPGAVEVIFNSEKVGARGKNRGPHAQKLIYITRK